MSKSSLQPALHRAHLMLDKLPPASVVLDRYGHAWQHGGSYAPYWYRAYGSAPAMSSYEMAQQGPFQVMEAIQ